MSSRASLAACCCSLRCRWCLETLVEIESHCASASAGAARVTSVLGGLSVKSQSDAMPLARSKARVDGFIRETISQTRGDSCSVVRRSGTRFSRDEDTVSETARRQQKATTTAQPTETATASLPLFMLANADASGATHLSGRVYVSAESSHLCEPRMSDMQRSVVTSQVEFDLTSSGLRQASTVLRLPVKQQNARNRCPPVQTRARRAAFACWSMRFCLLKSAVLLGPTSSPPRRAAPFDRDQG